VCSRGLENRPASVKTSGKEGVWGRAGGKGKNKKPDRRLNQKAGPGEGSVYREGPETEKIWQGGKRVRVRVKRKALRGEMKKHGNLDAGEGNMWTGKYPRKEDSHLKKNASATKKYKDGNEGKVRHDEESGEKLNNWRGGPGNWWGERGIEKKKGEERMEVRKGVSFQKKRNAMGQKKKWGSRGGRGVVRKKRRKTKWCKKITDEANGRERAKAKTGRSEN